VNALLLTLLTAALAALPALGALAVVWPRQARRILWTAAAVAIIGAAAALVSVTLAGTPAEITLPIGLPASPFRLTLDPLAAFFLALTLGAGTATLACSAATEPSSNTFAIPVCLGFLGLAVLGAEGLAQGAGLAAAGIAIWAAGPADRDGAVTFCVALLAGAAVIVAAAAPPQARLWAALIGPGMLAGLAPLHRWMAPAHRASTHAAALLSGAAVPTALYLMLRLLFDAGAAVPPAWWGWPLSLFGVFSALAGGLDATRAADLDTALAAGTLRQTGLAMLGLGIALTARAADLPSVETMALAAVLLLIGTQAIGGTLQALASSAVRAGAGTRQLDRLGGLVHRMPETTLCLLAALVGLTALPPSANFAAVWLLVHALIGLPHAAILPAQLLRCAMIAALGLASALGAAGLLRLVGVACLGRPRTPRAAVAQEQPRPARLALMALAAAVTVTGISVGPVLILFASQPLHVITEAAVRPPASWVGLASGTDSPGYASLPIACLLLSTVGIVLWLRRLIVRSSLVSGPAWQDGFAAPPAWLPFGDPATQAAGAGFAPDFARLFGIVSASAATSPRPRLPWTEAALWSRWGAAFATRRLVRPGSAPAIVLILLAVLLVLCSWTKAA